MCEELETIISDDVFLSTNQSEFEEFSYKFTQNIIIPVEWKYINRFQDNITEDRNLTLPGELSDLCHATKHFIHLIDGEVDYFISKRIDRVYRESKWFGFIHIVVHVGEVVRTKLGGDGVSFQTVHDSIEHLNLLKAGYSYSSELFACRDILSKTSFRYLLFSLAYNSITLMQGETQFWPFYGWSQ